VREEVKEKNGKTPDAHARGNAQNEGQIQPDAPAGSCRTLCFVHNTPHEKRNLQTMLVRN